MIFPLIIQAKKKKTQKRYTKEKLIKIASKIRIIDN